MPETPLPPPPDPPPPEPPPPPPPAWPEPEPAPPPEPSALERRLGELLEALKRLFPPASRRPLLLAGLSVAAIVLGLLVGRSAFRAPEAPSFEPRPEEPVAAPVEAQETTIEVPAAPVPRLPPGSKQVVDATDYGLLSRLQGDWQIDLGQRDGEIRVRFTDQQTSQLSQGGFQVKIYRCESRRLPTRFSLVRVPDGGNFIAFHGERGETRDVFENIDFQNQDVFSFTEATSGRRRYARRVGSASVSPPQVADAPPAQLEPPPTFEEPDSSLDENDEEHDELYGSDEQEVENLWKIARTQRSARQYGALLRTLDRLLELDPRHGGARRWKNEVQQQLREQNREALGKTQDLLDDFADAVEGHEMDDLRDLWGGRFDGESSRFFTQLFRRYPRLKVRASLVSVTVDGKNTTGFVATVTIEGREKGRRAETQEYSWHGRLQGGELASPFP